MNEQEIKEKAIEYGIELTREHLVAYDTDLCCEIPRELAIKLFNKHLWETQIVPLEAAGCPITFSINCELDYEWGDGTNISQQVIAKATVSRTQKELEDHVKFYEKLAESTKKKKAAALAKKKKEKKEKEAAELKLLEDLAAKHGKKIV